MSSNPIKAPLGRPKTFDRGHTLDVAMESYWADGVDGVSFNEICKRAKVSKPGLYREFGNEDGLMKAVLIQYQQQVITPMQQILTSDAPFRETLDNLVIFITAKSDVQDAPKGCLFVKLRGSRFRLGEATREQIDHTQQQLTVAFENLVERSKAKGEFSTEMPTPFAAAYIDSQIGNALSLLERGEKNETVRAILIMAFSNLV
ncbi:MAG: AcrR family transcriptional regulator [Gammaproteobacteria bacterium]|jgi:TetR/AcrR family transcriptional regulator, copper-responsive repressor